MRLLLQMIICCKAIVLQSLSPSERCQYSSTTHSFSVINVSTTSFMARFGINCSCFRSARVTGSKCPTRYIHVLKKKRLITAFKVLSMPGDLSGLLHLFVHSTSVPKESLLPLSSLLLLQIVYIQYMCGREELKNIQIFLQNHYFLKTFLQIGLDISQLVMMYPF